MPIPVRPAGGRAGAVALVLMMLAAASGCTPRAPRPVERAHAAWPPPSFVPLTIGLLISGELEDRALQRALDFAAGEVGHTLSLLGRSLVVERPLLSSDTAVDTAMEELARSGARIVVAVLESAALDRASAAAGNAGVLLLDARPRHDGRCAPWTFHVGVPERAAAGRAVALWSPSLDRYGAAQLNERFRRRMERDMDETAWAAWIAFKIAAEASLRARDASPAAIRDHLLNGRGEFDGHKGAPLSFSRRDHLLHQPLVALDGGAPSLIDWPAADDITVHCR